MRRHLVIISALVIVLSLLVAVPVGAEKPAPTLEGEMELFLDFPTDLVFDCYGVAGSLYTWRGTVSFPDLRDESFGMAFVNLGTGKAFVDDDPDNPFPPGQASFFTEIWAIYDGGVVVDSDGCPSTDAAAIWGTDSGVGTLSNSTYRMNGEVDPEGVGSDWFSGWEGRKVHMSGTFVFGSPWEAPGTFRLN